MDYSDPPPPPPPTNRASQVHKRNSLWSLLNVHHAKGVRMGGGGVTNTILLYTSLLMNAYSEFGTLKFTLGAVSLESLEIKLLYQ